MQYFVMFFSFLQSEYLRFFLSLYSIILVFLSCDTNSYLGLSMQYKSILTPFDSSVLQKVTTLLLLIIEVLQTKATFLGSLPAISQA